MRRDRFGAAVVCAAVVVLAAASWRGRAAEPAAGRAGADVQRWEYASYVQSPEVAVVNGLQERAVMERTIAKLYRTLGGTKPDQQVSSDDILNLLGARGWELVTVQPATPGAAIYWLKRPGGAGQPEAIPPAEATSPPRIRR